MKILYIQHTSVLGGSSKSLLELIDNLPPDVTPHVLCPKGPYSKLLQKKEIKIFTILGVPQFDNTRLGYYRGLRWLILLREFFYLPFFFFKIISLRSEKYDVVHINDITQVFTLFLIRLFLTKNIIMHCRAMCSNENTIRTKVLNKIFNNYAKFVVPIDESVSSSLPYLRNKYIVHNGLSRENINKIDFKRDKFTVCMVSNFQRYKGIMEFIDAANICINENKLDIDFVIYGASYQNNKSLKEKLFQMFGFRENMNDLIISKILDYDLIDKIILKGFVYSTDEIYNNLDLHVFPSHLNAVGRPVFEAAFYGVPSIVAIDEPFDDAIIDNKTGICIKEKDPLGLANAIEKLYHDRQLLAKMGEESHDLANKYYNSKKNTLEVYSLYKQIVKEKDV